MEYLERLDKALESLEKEADKLTGLSKLTNALGEVADELSAEKRQIKDAIQDLNIAKASIDNNTKDLIKKYQEAEEATEKKFKVINESFAANKHDIETKSELLDRRIDQSQKLLQEKIEKQTNELDNRIDSSQVLLNEAIGLSKKELNETINSESDKINDAIRKEHEDLNKRIDVIVEDIGNIKTQIDEFRTRNEKIGKIQIAIMSAAALFSLITCGLLLFA